MCFTVNFNCILMLIKLQFLNKVVFDFDEGFWPRTTMDTNGVFPESTFQYAVWWSVELIHRSF